MKRAPLLAAALAVVYFFLAFNAYACLIPLYGGIQVTKGSDCSMPEEQPARQHCDAYRTLGVQTMSSVQPLPDSLAQGVVGDVVSVPVLTARVSFYCDLSGSPLRFGRDTLSLTSILRL
jgi:hypothetical protein